MALLVLWLLDGAIALWCEAQWQDALGFGAAFQTRLRTQGFLFCATAFGTLGLAAWPLRIFASLPPARLNLPPRYDWVEWRLKSLNRLDARWLQFLILILAFLTAQDAARRWPQILLFNGDDWRISVTPWRLDAGLWTFQLPALYLLLDAAQRTVNVALLAALPLAIGRGAAQFLTRRPILPRAAFRCLALLGALWFASRAARFLLAPFDLALSPTGLTFLDWQARRPVLWLCSVLSLWMALSLLAACCFRVRASLRVGLAALIAPPLLLFSVPRLVALGAWDEPRREAPFRRAQLLATQRAWDLDDISIQERNLLSDAVAARRASLAWNDAALARLPLWDGARLRRAALCKGAALQIDRLVTKSGVRSIAVGVCEDAPGAVILDASSAASISTNLRATPPAIFGVGAAQSGPSEAGDMALDSLFTRLSWAWRLRDVRVLAARDKRLMFRPDMAERARALAPFLVPGGVPCAVMFEGRIVWMLDLLCVSDSFPGARGQTLSGRTFNAARDSVKMVMDSATGATHFYAARPDADPLLRAWQGAFPDLVQPMPNELREHQRYPIELLKIQAELLGETVGAQRWQAARQVGAADIYEAQSPFYALDERGLALHAVMSDSEIGDSTAAILTARCDGEEYGRLTLHRFDGATAPLDSGLAGPGAFDSRVRDALPVSSGSARAWKPGPTRALLRGGRVWLWQAVFREDKGAVPRLAAVIVGDAAWPNGPLGVGNSARAALSDWRRTQIGWTQSAGQSNPFARRLRAVLEPQAVQIEQTIAEQIALAVRLQDAAQIAEKSDAMAAARLRRQAREVLESLRRATGKNAPVEILPSAAPKMIPQTRGKKTTP